MLIVIMLSVMLIGLTDGGYLGCFTDASARDLPVYAYTSHENKVTDCIAVCTSKAYKFAGLQYGTECWCGDSFGMYGESSDDNCNSVCPGDSTQMCGSSLKNSVYSTGYLGCFKDSNTRDLPVVLWKMLANEASVEKCQSICKSRGNPVSGVQNSESCACGNTYGLYGERPKEECNTKCKGSSQMCGGVWRNSVYKTELLEGLGGRAK